MCTEQATDFHVENHGPVILVRPDTDAAREWIADYVDPEPWQWFAGAIAVEPRYLSMLLHGVEHHGLTFRLGT